jgi:hypothetical protein
VFIVVLWFEGKNFATSSPCTQSQCVDCPIAVLRSRTEQSIYFGGSNTSTSLRLNLGASTRLITLLSTMRHLMPRLNALLNTLWTRLTVVADKPCFNILE